MKRALFISLLIVIIAAAGGSLQAAPPPIKVSLALDKTTYAPGEPVLATLSLVNTGGDIITVEGFSARDFYLMLRFTDEDGKVITSSQFSDTSTPFPALPRVFPAAGGELIQGDLVETIETDWVLAYEKFDVFTYYALANKGGRYTAKAVIPIRTYLDYLQTASGIKYAPLDAVDFYGSLQSNVVSFTLVGDGDGDGYYYPQAYGSTTEVDCDDNNAAVNPGAAEILNNGIDDDCNPQTPDEGAVVVAGTIAVTVKKYTSDKGGPKEPLAGMELRAYDRTEGSCAADIGLYSRKYPKIWEQCSADGSGTTDDLGRADLSVPPGEYLLIGHCGPGLCGTNQFIGSRVEPVAAGQTVEKYLQTRVKATTGTIAVTVEKHSTGKGGTKEPLAGVELRAYNKKAGSCAAGIGVSYKKYPAIWGQCSGDGSGITDDEGQVNLSVSPGEYLLIGRCGPELCGAETFFGSGVDKVEAGKTVKKYLQVKVKATTGIIAVTVDKYTTGKGGSKEPLAGVELRAYDRTAGSCAGHIGISQYKYPAIWEQCSADGSGTTDDQGRVDLSVAPGEYLLIGRCGAGLCGAETFFGSGVDKLAAGKTVQKYLKVEVKEDKKKNNYKKGRRH